MAIKGIELTNALKKTKYGYAFKWTVNGKTKWISDGVTLNAISKLEEGKLNPEQMERYLNQGSAKYISYKTSILRENIYNAFTTRYENLDQRITKGIGAKLGLTYDQYIRRLLMKVPDYKLKKFADDNKQLLEEIFTTSEEYTVRSGNVDYADIQDQVEQLIDKLEKLV